MNAIKKQKKILPEVHILGDLEDAKNLLSFISKKKSIVVFKDGEEGTFYCDVKGKLTPINQEEITNLETDYRLMFFSFFPSKKMIFPVTEEILIIQEPEEEIKAEVIPIEAKVGKEKKVKKETKIKKPKKVTKNKKKK